uniref:F-box domain-containing protein n=1 Tax=Strongyloides venezuelensis TaxID=75913 RepID=A0A0K0FGQ7_STRVS
MSFQRPSMDFIDLPVDFKLQILKRFHWKDLNNLKLVCKNFYLTVVENVEKLDRPKVDCLKVCYGENKLLGADYDLKLTENLLTHGGLKHVEFSSDSEYEDFLKDKDFTKIKELVLRDIENSTVVMVYDSSFVIGNISRYDFTISLSNGTPFSIPLYVSISSTKNLEIPYSDSVLRKESLKKMGLFERGGSRLVIKKILMDILTGNPMLEYQNISNDSAEPMFIHITNNLCELGFLKLENRCDSKQFKLCFFGSDKFGVLEKEFYRNLFGKIKYGNDLVVEDNDERYYILNSINCSKCGTQHKNFILYEKSFRAFHIHIL